MTENTIVASTALLGSIILERLAPKEQLMRNLLGGKVNLAEMSGIGLPVPPGFTITTEVCTYFMTMAANIRSSWRRRSGTLFR